MSQGESLYTTKGKEIQWLTKDPMNYFNLTTLIFGGSNTGKTKIAEEIMNLCKDMIQFFIVVAPLTSMTVYKEIIPERCIFNDLSKKRMIQIWKRQEYLTQLCNIANDIDMLKCVFAKISTKEEELKIKSVQYVTNKKIQDIENDSSLTFGQKKAQKNALIEKKEKYLKTTYKDAIRENKDMLSNMILSPKEMIVVQFMDVNPTIGIIIDDCTEKFKTWKNYFKNSENVFESILFRGRHNNITMIVISHDDKFIETELRKNARVVFYTQKATLLGSLARTQSGFNVQERKMIVDMADVIFDEDEKSHVKKHQKFCYVREDMHPYKYTIADIYDFNFTNPTLKELINRMPMKKDNFEENPFIQEIIENVKDKKKRKMIHFK